ATAVAWRGTRVRRPRRPGPPPDPGAPRRRRADLRRDHRRRPRGVRHLPARGVPAPQGPAGGRLRHRPPGGHAAALRRAPRAAAGRRRLAGPVPAVLAPPPRGTGHRDRARQAGTQAARRPPRGVTMFDVDPQISAVDRRLGSRERDGREAKVVTISQAFDTDVEDLWQACTTAERLARWFAPVSGDLRLGGRYRIEGNAE